MEAALRQQCNQLTHCSLVYVLPDEGQETAPLLQVGLVSASVLRPLHSRYESPPSVGWV